LFDISDAIEAIEQIKLQLNNYQTFLQNRILRSAAEKELMVIGKAVSKLEKIDKNIQISDIRKIKDTRNIIVHDYDGVNYKIIWNIIQIHIPVLKTEVDKMINTSE